ncbi:MAG: iron-sulfur cluster assembly accessory protein [Myxococcota bacterium]
MALLSIKSKKEQTIRPDTSMGELAPDQIGISGEAAARLLMLLAGEKPGSLLRVGMQGGGCSGLKPFFAFEEEAGENDRVFSSMGVNVCVDPRSLAVIGGSWLDFDNGFKIKSQNLKKSCSCGESFSIA